MYLPRQTFIYLSIQKIEKIVWDGRKYGKIRQKDMPNSNGGFFSASSWLYFTAVLRPRQHDFGPNPKDRFPMASGGFIGVFVIKHRGAEHATKHR